MKKEQSVSRKTESLLTLHVISLKVIEYNTTIYEMDKQQGPPV